MKFTLLAGLLGLAPLLATAAPAIDRPLQRDVVRRQLSPSSSFSVSSGFASPTGAAFATGTAGASIPLSTATSCAINGQVVCNGPSQFGICNWGHVTFQPVANGTACVNGEITAAGAR